MKLKLFWGFIGSFSSATMCYFYFDQAIAFKFQEDGLQSFKYLNKLLTDAGLGGPYFVIAITCYVFFRWFAVSLNYFKDKKDYIDYYRNWSVHFFYSLLFSGFLIHLVKNLVGRQRPHLSPDFQPAIFNPLSFHWDYYSFPSGHSQVVFTAATMFSLAWPKFKYLFYLVATFLAFSRVVTHAHFMSDIIMGAYIGVFGSLVASNWVKKYEK